MAILQSPENIFSEAEISRKILETSAERLIFAKFQAPKFEYSEPEKMQFHTPSHSIHPLDSLLKNSLKRCLGLAAHPLKSTNPLNIGVPKTVPLVNHAFVPPKSSRTKRGIHRRGAHEKVKFPQLYGDIIQ